MVACANCGAPPPPVRGGTPATATPPAAPSASSTSLDAASPLVAVASPSEPLPYGALARLGTRKLRFGERGPVSASIDDGGRALTLEIEAGEARIRDLAGARELLRVPRAYSAALAPDGTFLLKAETSDAGVRVARFDIGEGRDAPRPRFEIALAPPKPKNKKEPPATLRSLAIAPDGAAFAAVWSSSDVTMLDASSGETRARFKAPFGARPELSAGGRRLLFARIVSGADAGSVLASERIAELVVVDGKTGRPLRRLEPGVRGAATLTVDGEQILGLSRGRLVAVAVDSGERKLLAEPGAADDPLVLALESGRVIAARGGEVALIHAGGRARVVRLRDGRELSSRPAARVFALGAKGERLLVDDGERAAKVIPEDGAARDAASDGHRDRVRQVAFAGEGALIVSRGEDARFWDASSGRLLGQTRAYGTREIAADVGAKRLALFGDALIAFDAERAPTVRARASIDRLTLAPTADQLLVHRSGETRLSLLAGADLAPIASADLGPLGAIAVAAATPRWAVALATAPRVSVLGPKLEVEAVLEGLEAKELALSPDGTLLFVAPPLFRGATRIDLATGKPAARSHFGLCCQALVVSPDGALLAAAAEDDVLLFQVAPRRLLARLRGHEGRVTSLAFSPDGRRLVSASEDTTLLVWDAAARTTQELVATTSEHASWRALAGPWGGGAMPSAGGRTSRGAIPPEASQIVSAGAGSCTLETGGAVRCWNVTGLSPVGRPPKPDVALEVPLPAKAIGLSAGGEGYFCARLDDGRVACWGTLFTPTSEDAALRRVFSRAKPEIVAGLAEVMSVGVGARFACALERAGAIRCWGHGARGELDGPLFAAEPVAVANVEKATALSVGSRHACALVGTAVRCWGDDEEDQVGAGTGLVGPARGELKGPFVEVAAGRQATCARRDDDALLCWGTLGDASFYEPTLVKADALRNLGFRGDRLCGETGTSIRCLHFERASR